MPIQSPPAGLPPTLRVAILGLGLMGGSVGKALRAAGFTGTISGFDIHTAACRAAHGQGVLDVVLQDTQQVFHDHELVVLCQPVGEIVDFLHEHRSEMALGQATVVDVASVKLPVVAAVAGSAAASRLVPCHPVAGRERSGWDAASATLFQGRLVILTPGAVVAPHSLALATAFWSALGAGTVRMTPAHHDQVLAATSHMPQVLSFAYLHSLAARSGSEQWMACCGTGFRSFARLGGSDAALWSDIAVHNAAAILHEIDHLSASLSLFRACIAEGRTTDLTRAFVIAHEFHACAGLQEPASTN